MYFSTTTLEAKREFIDFIKANGSYDFCLKEAKKPGNRGIRTLLKFDSSANNDYQRKLSDFLNDGFVFSCSKNDTYRVLRNHLPMADITINSVESSDDDIVSIAFGNEVTKFTFKWETVTNQEKETHLWLTEITIL